LSKVYVDQPVGRTELRALREIASEEEVAFFRRNPHLEALYRRRLLLIALCQGAALQFLGRGYGVNDFDIHFFYAQHPDKPRLSRAVKRTHARVGAFANAPIDFVRTVVPKTGVAVASPSPVDQIRAFLAKRPTANAAHLAEKAVVGLHPRDLFGVVVWPAV